MALHFVGSERRAKFGGAHTRTHAHTHTRTHAHHAHTHTRTHAHTHTRTHAHHAHHVHIEGEISGENL